MQRFHMWNGDGTTIRKLILQNRLEGTEVVYLFIYFICGLFSSAASSSDYIVSDDRITNEQWNGKNMEGSGRGLM
jgi:hypothetical protein